MKKLRFGDYEIHRFDRMNIGLFKVVPDGEDAKRGRAEFRESDDGRRLRFLGKYYGSYGAAARALHGILLSERIEDPAIATVADAIERASDDFRAVSGEIGRIGMEEDGHGTD